MRITNKMMNNNTLRNINSNKEYLDKLNNQMASGKKIVRPSDDPVTAIRALKLRSNLTEISQYYDRNTNDANAWLQATQDAVESTKGILTAMKAQFTTGATGTNTVESRNAILAELKDLTKQIYDDGNADYAGRSLFTGYRTGTDLIVQEEDVRDGKTFKYTDIAEVFSKADMDQVTHVSGKLSNDSVVDSKTTSVSMQTVDSDNVSRLRLAYDDLDKKGNVQIEIFDYFKKGDPGYDPDDPYKKNVKDTIPVSSVTTPDPAVDYEGYLDAAYNPGADEAYFIPETGEIILGKNVADRISQLGDDDKLEVKYDKTNFKAGDLRPEHYFDCIQTTDSGSITFDKHDQPINYDISSNQQMQINTYASELYVHGIGRDIEEITAAIENCNNADAKVGKLKAMLEDDTLTAAQKQNVKATLDAAEKEKSLVDDKLQRMFEHGLTTFSSYIDKATLAGTTVGTRIERMELVKNRLMDLKTTAKDLADKNENVEITDVAIDVTEAELNYNAALMATGKISQQNLLNYI